MMTVHVNGHGLSAIDWNETRKSLVHLFSSDDAYFGRSWFLGDLSEKMLVVQVKSMVKYDIG